MILCKLSVRWQSKQNRLQSRKLKNHADSIYFIVQKRHLAKMFLFHPKPKKNFQLKIEKRGKIVNDLVDIDFEQTVMKYDSTGMFHWTPARAIEECIIVSRQVVSEAILAIDIIVQTRNLTFCKLYTLFKAVVKETDLFRTVSVSQIYNHSASDCTLLQDKKEAAMTVLNGHVVVRNIVSTNRIGLKKTIFSHCVTFL